MDVQSLHTLPFILAWIMFIESVLPRCCAENVTTLGQSCSDDTPCGDNRYRCDNLECKLAPGSVCSETEDCAGIAKCDRQPYKITTISKCRLPLAASCDEHYECNSTYCGDLGNGYRECRLEATSDCSSQPSSCAVGTECLRMKTPVATLTKCKYIPGYPCEYDWQCKPGTCYNLTRADGTITRECKLKPGANCFTKQECPPTAKCVVQKMSKNEVSKCKLKLNELCEKSFECKTFFCSIPEGDTVKRCVKAPFPYDVLYQGIGCWVVVNLFTGLIFYLVLDKWTA